MYKKNCIAGEEIVKISVIIPTHNRAELLINAINSVRRQTEERLEILVCDDGSTDLTKEAVLKLANEDPRIRYIDCGNNGHPAIPRNIGIKEARGEWLAFLDDDDIWNPVKLEIQLFLLNKKNEKACCSNAFVYEDNYNTGVKYFKEKKDDLYFFRDMIDENPIICSSMIIHKSIIEKCVGFPEAPEFIVGEDYALWHRIAAYTNIIYIDDPLTGYLIDSNSSVRRRIKRTFSEQKTVIDKDFSAWLKDKNVIIKLYYIKEKIMYVIERFYRTIKTYLRRLLSKINVIYERNHK